MRDRAASPRRRRARPPARPGSTSLDGARVVAHRVRRALPVAARPRESARAAGATRGAPRRTPSASARRRAGRRRSARRGRRARSRASSAYVQPTAPRHRARLGEQMRGHHGRGEVQGGHGGQRVASEETVERLPALLPELLAVLDHHAAQREPPPSPSAAVLRRVPRRRGRERPVDDDAEVEHRVDQRAPRAGSARGGAAACRRPSRAGRGTTPSAPTRAPCRRGAIAPGLASARCRRSVGQLAEPERAVDAHRVVDAHARARAPRDRRGASRRSRCTPTSAARRPRRRARASAAHATHSATGAAAAAAVTTGGGIRTRGGRAAPRPPRRRRPRRPRGGR